MSTGDVLLVAAAVLLAIGFAVLVVVLLRVLDVLRTVRAEVATLRAETEPLLDEMRTATDEAGRAVRAARADLERFDRVVGSAEAVGDAMSHTSRVTRTAFSAPVIKAAGLATGTSRAVRRLRRRPVELPRRRVS